MIDPQKISWLINNVTWPITGFIFFIFIVGNIIVAARNRSIWYVADEKSKAGKILKNIFLLVILLVFLNIVLAVMTW